MKEKKKTFKVGLGLIVEFTTSVSVTVEATSIDEARMLAKEKWFNWDFEGKEGDAVIESQTDYYRLCDNLSECEMLDSYIQHD